jgi:hypothetical protein
VNITEVAALISALASIGAVLAAWHNSKKIHNVHVDLNSRLSELLKTTHDAAFQAGKKEGEKRE